MSAPIIALATSQPEGAVAPGERLLAEALTRAGSRAFPVVWSLPDIDWQQFSAVVIRTCWDYHLRMQEFLAWIERLEAHDIPVINHPDLIRWNAHKGYLKYFAAQGVAIPETVWLETGELAELEEICRGLGWNQAVVKPLVSASAYGTERRNTGPVRGPLMIQQYLSAIETEGEWSLVFFDHQFSHAVRKRSRLSDFRVQKEYGGTVERDEPKLNRVSFAEKALRNLPRPATFARVDLVEQEDKIYLMEMEVIEPELFLDYASGSAEWLANSILKEIPQKR